MSACATMKRFLLLGSYAHALAPAPNARCPFRTLCHRGVAPSLVREIADVLRRNHHPVIAQNGDGLSLSLPVFRRQAAHHLETTCYGLVVLLSRDFPGSVYRQTLGGIENQAQRDWGKGQSIVIRVDDCETN